jgi:hypothetical protein
MKAEVVPSQASRKIDAQELAKKFDRVSPTGPKSGHLQFGLECFQNRIGPMFWPGLSGLGGLKNTVATRSEDF